MLRSVGGTSMRTRSRSSNRARSMSRYDSIDVELAAERRELAFRAQHAAQQRRQPQQRLERPRRRRLNQVADRRQRVEQEVRVDLRAQRAQLGFGRQLADLLLAQLALVALARDPDGVDAPRDDHARSPRACATSSDSRRRPPVSGAIAMREARRFARPARCTIARRTGAPSAADDERSRRDAIGRRVVVGASRHLAPRRRRARSTRAPSSVADVVEQRRHVVVALRRGAAIVARSER